jgi:plastocyanin
LVKSVQAALEVDHAIDEEASRYTYVCDPHSQDMIGSFRVK